MNTLWLIVRITLGILPFAILAYFSLKFNLSKEHRVYQFPMIFLAGLYCFLISWFLDPILKILMDAIIWLAQYLTILNRVNWTYGILYVANVAILIGFILIKMILLPLIKAILKRMEWVFNPITSFFYDHDKSDDLWLLLRKWHQTRDYFHGFYIAAILVSCLIFILTQSINALNIFSYPFYPVFGIIILGEVVFYLGGLSQVDQEIAFEIENDESVKDLQFERTYNELMELFGDKVTFDHLNRYKSTQQTAGFDTLDKMTTSEVPLIRSIGMFYKKLSDNGFPLDMNYVDCSLKLLYGKSVLISNPYYHDLTNYVLFPMLKQLMSYRKVVIISGRDGSEQDLVNWIQSGIRQITNVDSLWKIDLVTNTDSNLDVCIIPQYQLYNHQLLSEKKEFLSEVTFMILIEPSLILATAQMGITMLLKSFNPEFSQTYCIFDRNGDGLVDTLSHVLKTNLTEVLPTLHAHPQSVEMHWAADSMYMHLKQLPNVARYLGVGSEVGLVGLQNQFDDIEWFGGSKFPVEDMKWILSTYYDSLKNINRIHFKKDTIESAMKYRSNLFNSKISDNAYFLVEDEFRNAFEISRLFSTRIRESGFINIISEDYLLKEYMAENYQTFKKDPKAIPLIVPDFARTERNTVIRLIMLMMARELSETDIKTELMLTGIEAKDAIAVLIPLIRKHCYVDTVDIRTYSREEYLDDGVTTIIKRYYSIPDEGELGAYANNLRNAYYITEDDIENKNIIGAKLYGHIFQALLPSQFITLSGKYYEVVSVNLKNGIILRRAADHLDYRHYYHQKRQITVESWKTSTGMGSQKKFGDIEIIQGYADFTVETGGYLDMKTNNGVLEAKHIYINGIPTRRYRNKQAILLKLNGLSERARFTITLLLNEIFKTTYPENYRYLNVVTHTYPKVDDKLNQLVYGVEGDLDEEGIYFFEDSEIDLGLISSIERNIQRYLEIVTEFLTWHEIKMKEVVPNDPAPLPKDPVEKAEEIPPTGIKKIWGSIKKSASAFLGFIAKIFKGNKTKTTTADALPAASELPPISEEDLSESADEQDDVIDSGMAVFDSDPDFGLIEDPSAETEASELPSDPTDDDLDLEDIYSDETDLIKDDTITSETDLDTVSETGTSDELDLDDTITPETDLDAVSETETNDDLDIDLEEDKELSSDVDAENTKVLRSIAMDPSYEGQSEMPDPDEDSENSTIRENDTIEDLQLKKTKYQKQAYILYGMENISEELELSEALEFLNAQGFGLNALRKARESTLSDEGLDAYKPHKENTHYCDFCMCEMGEGGFEILKDGRERCPECSSSVIRTSKDFVRIFMDTKKRMEDYFGIQIETSIAVKMVNAKKLAQITKSKFEATIDFDGRTVGMAEKTKKGYTLYLENGSPKLSTISTIVHEMTHIWQFRHFSESDLIATYGKENLLNVYEGMASWAQVYYMIGLNEYDFAYREHILLSERNDEYGIGYRRYLQQYPLVYSMKKPTENPFKHKLPLPIEEAAVVTEIPDNEVSQPKAEENDPLE